MSIIIFLIILAILILVHEFGHFIVAKKSGIRVEEFGLGFPPKIFSKKFGDTLYTLNAIPFGGFVKIFGEDAHSENISEESKKYSFAFKPKWIQVLVLVAGVTMNFIFAWLVISLGFMIGQPAPVDYSQFGKVSDLHLVITEVIPNSPANKAGLISGDLILKASSLNESLDGESLTPESVRDLISNSNSTVDITYSRGKNSPKKVSILPDDKIVSGRKAIGIGMDNIGILKLSIGPAILEGAHTSWLILKGTTIGLLGFFSDAIKFKSDLSQVTGPVGIASVVGEANSLGFVYLLSIIAVISINLTVINLLPFPALDGGRLLFIAIEAIIRRPIKPAVVKWTNTIGFIFLLTLMVVVTAHDILKLL